MRKSPNTRLIAVSLLGAICLILGALGCGSVSSTTLMPSASTTVKPVPATTTTTEIVVLDLLSTFEAKDPFIQQAVSTTKAGTSTTKAGTTSTTKAGTTTTGSGTTSTTGSGSSTSTTANGRHSMKALSISTTNGTSTATIEVDDVVYQNKRVGDVLSTGWGQVKITRIDVSAQSVTVLHGSETRVLYVGQEIIK